MAARVKDVFWSWKGKGKSAFPTNVYQPLESGSRQIRVLRIGPAPSEKSMIQASLVTIDLQDERHTFSAASYVWGQATSTAFIQLDGHRFEVKDNVYSLLVRLRSKFKPIFIWIDAICINQQDMRERGQQVAFMGEIYSAATKVVIWLGCNDRASESAIRLIKYWAKIERKSGHDHGTDVLAKYPKAFDEDAWRALQELSHHPWFSRMWTFQEYVRAQDIVWWLGTERLYDIDLWAANCMWDKLKKGSFTPVSAQQSSSLLSVDAFANYRNRVVLRSLYHSPDDSEILQELGETERIGSSRLQRVLHWTDCGDPRDKIYAVLDAVKMEDLSVAPDYNKSCADVYLEFATQILASSQSLDLLDCAGVGISSSDTPLGQPSWVPDFRASSKWPDKLTDKGFCASRESRVNIDFADEGRTLQCAGYIIDTIASVLHGVADDVNSRTNWCTHVLKTRNKYFCGIPRIQALVRTVIIDTSQHNGQEPPITSAAELKAFYEGTTGFMWAHGGPALEDWLQDPEKRAIYEPVLRYQFTRVSGYAINFAAMWYGPDLSPHLRTDELVFEPFLNGCSPDSNMIWPFDQGRQDYETGAWKSFVSAYSVHSSENTKYRAFFETSKGFMGLAPEKLQVGDQLCILLGSALPVILRPDSSGTYHQLVGTCYVYGLMHGEALRYSSEELGLEKMFSIR